MSGVRRYSGLGESLREAQLRSFEKQISISSLVLRRLKAIVGEARQRLAKKRKEPARDPEEEPPVQPFQFMRLPRELRDRIYEMVLPQDQMMVIWPQIILTSAEVDQYNNSIATPHSEEVWRPKADATSIMRTCRQLREETKRTFYGGNTFYVPMSEECEGWLAKWMKRIGEGSWTHLRSLLLCDPWNFRLDYVGFPGATDTLSRNCCVCHARWHPDTPKFLFTDSYTHLEPIEDRNCYRQILGDLRATPNLNMTLIVTGKGGHREDWLYEYIGTSSKVDQDLGRLRSRQVAMEELGGRHNRFR